MRVGGRAVQAVAQGSGRDAIYVQSQLRSASLTSLELEGCRVKGEGFGAAPSCMGFQGAIVERDPSRSELQHSQYSSIVLRY